MLENKILVRPKCLNQARILVLSFGGQNTFFGGLVFVLYFQNKIFCGKNIWGHTNNLGVLPPITRPGYESGLTASENWTFRNDNAICYRAKLITKWMEVNA